MEEGWSEPPAGLRVSQDEAESSRIGGWGQCGTAGQQHWLGEQLVLRPNPYTHILLRTLSDSNAYQI